MHFDDDDIENSLDPFEKQRRNPLVSFPASIENRLAQARSELARPQESAASLMREAFAELARSNSELFALMAGTQMGFKELTFNDQYMERTVVETESRLFGVKVGSSVTVTTVTRGTRRSIGFS